MHGALMLNFGSLKVEDQFGAKPDWKSIGELPTVMVFAGEKASELAKEWGISLHKSLNGDYVAGKTHLQTRDPREMVKVIAVATLPSVPGMFRGMFRSGFRKKSEMAMLLDFSSELSQKFSYLDSEELPALVVIPSTAADFSEVKVFRGKPSDEALRAQIFETIKKTH